MPILMYHQISTSPTSQYARYSHTPRQFSRQMGWLARRGYTSLSLDQLLRCRAGLDAWPLRPVVITIDDGYADAVRRATDILPRFGFTATVFLVAGAIGGVSRWGSGPSLPIVNWNDIRGIVAAGVTCGVHTMTHPRLATLPIEECLHEIEDARHVLEDGLGTAVNHLAYPFGSVNAQVRELAAKLGYRTACAATTGLSGTDDDPLRLHRVHIFGSETFADFLCRLRTARPLGEMVRARLRRITGVPVREPGRHPNSCLPETPRT